MAILLRGFARGSLTDAMVRSGIRVDLSDIPGVKVDKHTTGGVGDKTSILLAPIVAACGVAVPMMSGRGLGHTGGTLDKLESIPGFRVDCRSTEFEGAARRSGVRDDRPDGANRARRQALRAARRDRHGRDASADRASIMSKKIAEGIDALVLDVKTGRGAFMKTEADSRLLAESLVAIGQASGVRNRRA